jgi:excisionase family DNA binding protein
MNRKFATKQDVMREFQVSIRTVDKWMHERRIPYSKLGRLVRFDLKAVQKALARYTIREAK